jgi:hypothetical protein
MEVLIDAASNPRRTAAVVEDLVNKHGESVWGRNLGARSWLKTPNDEKMHLRNRITWEVGVDQKRYVQSY